jgi:hypothetical protein
MVILYVNLSICQTKTLFFAQIDRKKLNMCTNTNLRAQKINFAHRLLSICVSVT